jgi:hypothetical protein
MRMNRHGFGTVLPQTRALSPGIVNDEGGGLGPSPLKMRGGGRGADVALRDMAV